VPAPQPAARLRSIAVAVLAAVAIAGALAIGGCGGGDGAAGGSGDGGAAGGGGSSPATLSPSPGAETVLVVVPDTGFQQSEYQAVQTALSGAGYPMQIANALGDDSISGDDVHVRADLKIADADAADYAGVVLIGGPGTTSLFDDADLHALVRETAEQGKLVSAICLAPVILARAGVLEGKQATVWEDQRAELEENGCSARDKPVVVDGLVITGNGPDAAPEFAAAVVEALRAER
jgi:protease I